MVEHRLAARVIDRDRFLRERDRVDRGGLARVRRIDEHLKLVHRRHHIKAECRQTGVGSLEAAVAEKISRVVCELHAEHSECSEVFQPRDIVADRRRVLRVSQDAQPVRPPRLDEVDRSQHSQQPPGLARDVRVGRQHFRLHVVERRGSLKRRIPDRHDDAPKSRREHRVDDGRVVVRM